MKLHSTVRKITYPIREKDVFFSISIPFATSFNTLYNTNY